MLPGLLNEHRPDIVLYDAGVDVHHDDRSHPPPQDIDNLLVRNHFIIVMIRWTGLAPWEFEFPFPGNLTSTFLV